MHGGLVISIPISMNYHILIYFLKKSFTKSSAMIDLDSDTVKARKVESLGPDFHNIYYNA